MGVSIDRDTRGRISAVFMCSPYSSVFRLFAATITVLVIVAVSLFIANVSHASPPCPCNLFTSSQPSSQPSLYAQGTGIEVGFKFKADQNGYISGIRFYKVAGMAGTHTASLWNPYGIRIAQAIFSGESATGWQEVDFSPVAVTANTIYTASVFMADGNYNATPNFYTSDIINSPLLAPKDGTAHDAQGYGNQGVYDASGSNIYPIYSFNATNYWIDVSYVSSTSTSPISVSSKSPAASSTNVSLTDAITATFDRAVDASTVSSSSFIVKDAQNNVVPGVTSYDSTTYTAKFIPNTIWQTDKTYTVTLNGNGTNPAIADLQGYTLAANYAWSFTTTATALACPCAMRDGQNPAGSQSYRDGWPNGLELGMKVIPTANGYLTALRFYKPIINPETTHLGNVWDANGTNLASATFTNESSYGWQEATLATALPVVKDKLYIISYGTPISYYQAKLNSFTQPMVSPGFIAYPAGDARNTSAGSGAGNQVYATTSGSYPATGAMSNMDYYLDAVFSLTANPTAPSPKVINTQPEDKSYSVLHTATASATFDQPMDSATVNNSTVTVVDKNGTAVAGTALYDSGKRTITFTPTSSFAYTMTYTMRLSSQISDLRGASLGTDYSWTFTIGSPLASDMNQGNGGPILVVTTTANPSSTYYAEILRTEGFNYFDVNDISVVSASTLQNYKAVVLSEMTLTQPQVDMLSSWVNGGGRLITMRPDKKLAGLLGLTDASSTATNQYLRTNVASKAGIGIVDDTIQFKGTADHYNLSGADVVARLYSDSTTVSPYPAATSHSVGAGMADSFTYDLAKSVIGLHQGNIAWSGQDRDGDLFLRTYDLFYGPAAGDVKPDWLDPAKMAIPQADEQQRLLANMITEAMRNDLPAPRFWYLPNDQKAALVLAGDDHNRANATGTEQQNNDWLNDSSIGCSVMDWQCVRASHYVFVGSALTDARASQYASYGFEIGDHLSKYDGGCTDPATGYSQFNSDFAINLATWRAKYVSLPFQQTSRYHCYTWNSWDMTPRADFANGIRYDLGSVAYPAAWVGSRSPLVTGSGMNMRLTDASGAMLDVRQGVTNFDNTSAGATSVAATFDNALGASGYYGIFGSHYDFIDNYANTLFDVASSRNIPIISSQQALTWLDGRNSSNFTNLTSTQRGKESFTIVNGEGAYGLQAMVPVNDSNGSLTQLTRAGQPVSYRTDIIKGVPYVIFSALPGQYDVTYSDLAVASAPIINGSASSSSGQSVYGYPGNGTSTSANVLPESKTLLTDEFISQIKKPTLQSTQLTGANKMLGPWIFIAWSVVLIAAAGGAVLWLRKED